MNSHPFEKFHLNASILRALSEEGYVEPTGIQHAAIPPVLEGRDLVATAQTGTGKTAAFALPIIEMLHRRQDRQHGIRALVLTPTRELALQIETSFRTYGRHLNMRSTAVVGGASFDNQVRRLRQHPDILVATPGRLLDLLRQRQVQLGQVEILVLDEADRMLDMGFIHDVQTIASHTGKTRQTLLFSATMPPAVTGLADSMMHDPVRVQIAPAGAVADNIDQRILFVEQANKGQLLAAILKSKDVSRAIVFTRTKHRADRLVKHLAGQGIPANAIHSNKSQNARQKTLAAFGGGRVRVLVATDIVARGIDVDEVSHVINYELPEDPENYVHRVGRTARAGSAGKALSFCDATEVILLKGIEKLTRAPMRAVEDHPFHSTTIASLHNHRPADSNRPVQWRSFGPGGRSGRRSGRFR